LNPNSAVGGENDERGASIPERFSLNRRLIRLWRKWVSACALAPPGSRLAVQVATLIAESELKERRITMAIRRRNAAAGEPIRENPCIGGMCDPQRIQGLKAPAPKGTHDLINLTGPGLFLAGHVTKQGGATGLSFVRLQIDGRSVVDLSFAAAHNSGLTQQNPFGLVVLGTAGLQTFTFGWPVPLVFRRRLNLSVVVNETGVVQIVANVIRGSLP